MAKHNSPQTQNYLKKQATIIAAAKAFANGMPIKEVMEKYNISYASVYNAIKKYNIEYTYTYGRTIFFNENYFQNITTEHQAYWLGFLYADGSICKTDKRTTEYNRLTFTQSIRDIERVQAFAQDIDMPLENIKVHNNHGYSSHSQLATLQCNSTKMCQDLIAIGYIPLKTQRNNIPDMPEELINHFIRGFIDGDGSIYGDYKCGSFDIQSSGGLVSSIIKVLHEQCNVPIKTPTFTKNSLRVKYGGRVQIERIMTYLYNNATTYMQRKFNAFCHRCFHI